MKLQALICLVTLTAWCASCKRPPSEAPMGNAPALDAWTQFEDADFRFSVPPGWLAKVGRHGRQGLPGFSTYNNPQFIGSDGGATFVPSDRRVDLLARDAAELELKDYVAGGGRVLKGVTSIPMTTGNCAAFVAVSKSDADSATLKGGQHYFIAHCDTPLKTRYLFLGPLGATDEVNKRPPNFAEHAANFERILRSVEFKKSAASP